MQHPIGQNDPAIFAKTKENQYFDRKSARIKPNDAARHIVAFANASGGKLVIGIEDSGEITGFRFDGAQNVGLCARTLKELAAMGILEWHGSSTHDPSQYYTLSR